MRQSQETPQVQAIVARFGCFNAFGDKETAQERIEQLLWKDFNEMFKDSGVSITVVGLEPIPVTDIDEQNAGVTSFRPDNLWFDVASPCKESAIEIISKKLRSDELKAKASELNVDLDWIDFEETDC